MKKATQQNLIYQSSSFTAYLFADESFNHAYHFHKEHEIMLVESGRGTLMVNDELSHFSEGDIFILGSNTPHAFICDKDVSQVKSLVVQFSDNCFGEDFFQIPEFRQIGLLLKKSKGGIRIRQKKKFVSKLIVKTCQSDGAMSVICLLQLLISISQLKGLEQIVSSTRYTPCNLESHKLKAAIDWINNNYANEIHLEEIASITNMTKNAFCRSFKKFTGKTFLEYLNDKRVDVASKQLVNTNDQVLKVAYDVGFTNISSFNRYFKKIKGETPKTYRENVLAITP